MKKLLVTLGIVFLVIVIFGGAGIAYLAWHGNALDAESKLYVDDAIPAITGDWNVALLEERECPELKAAVSDAQWDKIFSKLKTLGGLKAYHGAKGTSIMSMKNGQSITTAKYTAQAEYEKGPAEIQVVLIKRDNEWRIARFYVSPQVLLESM